MIKGEITEIVLSRIRVTRVLLVMQSPPPAASPKPYIVGQVSESKPGSVTHYMSIYPIWVYTCIFYIVHELQLSFRLHGPCILLPGYIPVIATSSTQYGIPISVAH
jgi:hypothetical protein